MIALIAIESSTLRIDYGNSSMHFSSPEPKTSVRRPSVAKLYVEPPWVGGTKVCSQHLGHMTRWLPHSYMVKIFKTFSSPEPVDRYPRNLVCSIGDTPLHPTFTGPLIIWSFLFHFSFYSFFSENIEFNEAVLTLTQSTNFCFAT